METVNMAYDVMQEIRVRMINKTFGYSRTYWFQNYDALPYCFVENCTTRRKWSTFGVCPISALCVLPKSVPKIGHNSWTRRNILIKICIDSDIDKPYKVVDFRSMPCNRPVCPFSCLSKSVWHGLNVLVWWNLTHNVQDMRVRQAQ